MKKIFTLTLVLACTAFVYAQDHSTALYQETLSALLNPPAAALSSLTKVRDSVLFQRINQTGDIRLEKKDLFRYDSLAQEIQELDYYYDINTDTLLYIDHFNTTYNPGQIVASFGRTVLNQYTDSGRKTENFRGDGALENTLDEVWDAGAGTFVNQRFISNHFIAGTDLVDSIITRVWDTGGQQWQLDRWDYQYFGNDDLRDSVYTYRWDNSNGSWKLDSKITSQYDALGQQTQLRLSQWDNANSNFVLQLEVLEYFNGDEFKDSTHVYTYFGGYYSESFTVFNYENDLVVSDTVYTWNPANGLQLSNYQEYLYDEDDDLEEARTYAYDPSQAAFIQITQLNYFYSELEVATGLEEAESESISCRFANPYLRGSHINCDLESSGLSVRARVYGLDGRRYFDQALAEASFQLPQSLAPGLYILSLETKNGQMQQYKLVIQP